jgi:hypothetical protein
MRGGDIVKGEEGGISWKWRRRKVERQKLTNRKSKIKATCA